MRLGQLNKTERQEFKKKRKKRKKEKKKKKLIVYHIPNYWRDFVLFILGQNKKLKFHSFSFQSYKFGFYYFSLLSFISSQ